MTASRPYFCRIALCLALTAAAAPAMEDSICRMSFFALSATPAESEALAVTTYANLLDLPRAGTARERWLNDLLKAEDPFAVPDGDAQLDAVRKPLKEFRRMLEKLGWETPELRRQMLEAVRERIEGAKRADEDVVRTIKENPGVVKFPVRDGQFVKITPDGRYYVTLSSSPSGQTEVEIHDAVTGKETTTRLDESPGAHYSAFALNSDGSKIVMGSKGPPDPTSGKGTAFVKIHEVTNGKVNLSGKRIDFIDQAGIELTKVVPLHNPDWLVVEVNPGFGNKGVYFQLIDLAKGTAYPIPIVESEYGAISAVPGRNAITFIPRENDPKKQRLIVVTVGAGGVSTRREYPLPENMDGDVDAAQGDFIVIRDYGKRTMDLYGPNGKVKALPVHQPQPEQFQAHALLHPNGKEYAVMSVEKATNQFLAYWYDMAKQERIGELRVPVGVFRLTPDGEGIVVKNDRSVQIIPLVKGVEPSARPK